MKHNNNNNNNNNFDHSDPTGIPIRMEFRSSEFKQIFFHKALTANKKLEVINQPWLGYYTTKIWESSEISPVSKRIHSTWKNIPDVVKSVNDSIEQQLIKTKVYIKNRLM